jgi:hypothetical protein
MKLTITDMQHILTGLDKLNTPDSTPEYRDVVNNLTMRITNNLLDLVLHNYTLDDTTTARNALLRGDADGVHAEFRWTIDFIQRKEAGKK